MGSFLSAILAGATVALAEHRFYERIGQELGNRVAGIRYADDGLALIKEWRGAPSAQEVFERFRMECYPNPLELEVEDHEGSFNLLESTVKMLNNEIQIIHRSKTWQELEDGKRVRYRVWTDASSYSSGLQGILIGAFMRAQRNCTPRLIYERLRTGIRMAIEANELAGYSDQAIRGAVEYLRIRDGNCNYFWRLLGKLIGHGKLRQRLQALEEGANQVMHGRIYEMALKMHWILWIGQYIKACHNVLGNNFKYLRFGLR
jgi:hypothetical protein